MTEAWKHFQGGSFKGGVQDRNIKAVGQCQGTQSQLGPILVKLQGQSSLAWRKQLCSEPSLS